MDNILKLNTEIELLEDTSAGEAFASTSLNPTYQWAKIVVTDDEPNENRHRIPKDEFKNLIKTGTFAPVKMAESEISRGHDEAYGKPVGTITQFAVEGNRLIALSALWKKERPDDISLLKDMYTKGLPPQVSWEVAYAEEQEEDDGVTALIGTILTGLAIVSNPAYAGRTSFVAMSSKDKDKDDNEEADSVEDLEKANERIVELEKALEKAENTLKEMEDYSEIKSELETMKAELDELREFKAEFDRKEEEAKKLNAIKDKFDEAGIEKDEGYFTENKDHLLGLEDSALDFMIQELVAFSENQDSTDDDTDDGEASNKIPNIRSRKKIKNDPRSLGTALRERETSKEK